MPFLENENMWCMHNLILKVLKVQNPKYLTFVLPLYIYFFFFTGPLLEAVQMARIYPDSKTFVDKKLKYPPNKIIKNFESLLNQQQDGSLLSVDQIKQFVQDHFDEEGQELEPWIPGDMTIIFL